MQEVGMVVATVIAIAMLIFAARPRPALALKKKFVQLGTLPGRHKDEILAVVGPVTTFSATGAGKSVLQWQRVSSTGAYHIALLFSAENVCEAVTHEHDATK